MTTAEIRFDILGYWHAGSGAGQGADLDAVVVKSAAHLPYLPGKTVKGLFRDAMTTLEELKKIGPKNLQLWFGGLSAQAPAQSGGKSQPAGRYTTDPGKLRFSNAVPRDIDESWAKAYPAEIRSLYAELAATEIDDNGLAASKSLRKIEVVIPLSLTARIEADEDDGWIAALKQTAPLIRSLGSHRRRGLGRVRVTVQGGQS